MRYNSISEIMRANKEAGYYFFEPDTLRFFKSKIAPTVYGGRYFVTSEQRINTPRYWTVREALPSGDIRTVGAFQQYRSARTAKSAARDLVAADEEEQPNDRA